MQFTPNIQLYLFILIVVGLLLLLMWFTMRNRWKAYAAHLTEGLLASNHELKKIEWSEVSPPDANGLRTTTGEYELTSDSGTIRLTASEKDADILREFIKEAKFYFEPIFEKIPSSPMRQLSEVSSEEGELDPEEQKSELVVEMTLQAHTKSGTNDTYKQIQAIAFIIDPRLAQRRSQTYSATGTAAYSTVSVSEGSVNASLNPGARRSNRANIRTGNSASLSSETFPRNRRFRSKVTGTSGSNYYRLSGTWNVG